jgi:hypothetical protein
MAGSMEHGAENKDDERWGGDVKQSERGLGVLRYIWVSRSLMNSRSSLRRRE